MNFTIKSVFFTRATRVLAALALLSATYVSVADNAAAHSEGENNRIFVQDGNGADSKNIIHEIRRIIPDSKTVLTLTENERAFIRKHPVVRVGYDVMWPPMEFVDSKGKYRGISADYLAYIGLMLGIEFRPVKAVSWPEMLKGVEEKSIDILPALMRTPEREVSMTFTRPYISLPVVIVTDQSVSYIERPEFLKGKTVAAVEGYAVNAFLTENYPWLNFVTFKDARSCLRAVSNGKVFAFAGNLATVSHLISVENLSNLKVSGQIPLNLEIAMGIRRDWEVFAAILQKALDNFPEKEKSAVHSKWMGVKIQVPPDYSLMWRMGAVAVAVLIMFAVWNRRLSREIAKRKKAEAVLEEARISSELALDGADVGLWTGHLNDAGKDVPIDNHVWEWDKRFSRMLGLPDDTKPDAGLWLDKVHPADSRRIRAKFISAMNEGSDFQIAHRLIWADKSIHHVTLRGRFSFDSEGKAIRVDGVAFDMTLLKQAQEELRIARFAIESAGDSIFMLRYENGRLFDVNRQACRLTGYSRDDLMSDSISDLILDISADHWLNFRRDIVENKFMFFESRMRRKNGGTLSVEISINYLEYDEQQCFVAYVRDISHRKSSEKRLKESEERFKLGQKFAGIGTWELDLVTETFNFSEQIPEFIGRPKEMTTMSLEGFMDAVYSDDREKVKSALNSCIIRSQGLNIEFRIKWTDGSLKWLQARGDAVWGDNLRPLNILGIMQDVTTRVKAREELAIFNKTMVGREMRIIELKEEVNRLSLKSGGKTVYAEVWKNRNDNI